LKLQQPFKNRGLELRIGQAGEAAHDGWPHFAAIAVRAVANRAPRLEDSAPFVGRGLGKEKAGGDDQRAEGYERAGVHQCSSSIRTFPPGDNVRRA
jgi:hypothetical protein